MRMVKRDLSKGPSSLLTAGGAGPSELARAIKVFENQPHRQKKKVSFSFRAYKGDDVRHALEALFHGKCTYCESRYDTSAPVDVEHFRPKGPGEDHPGYWWLAAEWTNLLPSCIDCNRRRFQLTLTAFASLSAGLEEVRRSAFARIKTGKESCFPIASTGVRMVQRPEPGMAEGALAAELPLLLDPCCDLPEHHIRFFIDRMLPLGIVYPAGEQDIVLPVLPAASEKIDEIENAARKAGVSVRGAVSIQVYGLNRLSLVQERTRLLRRLEFLASLVIELYSTADSLEGLAIAPGSEGIRDIAVTRIRAAASRTLAEIRAMGSPRSSYSEMVRAWINVFVNELGGSVTESDRT